MDDSTRRRRLLWWRNGGYYQAAVLRPKALRLSQESGRRGRGVRRPLKVRDVLDIAAAAGFRVLKALEQQVVELEVSRSSDEQLRQRKTDLQLLTFKLFDALHPV
ncbi:hypothetical protein GN958_ATG23380 [Phytophthora infestans]|uniref:Uncharacterized protein n=1 Tax=Phytophthora infestans TaxID=4787 RepID=A0A8S9TH25_PHYIN|nr:hypothetical protein GN958_ATG23380 [Phytophthora infestans]